MIPAGLPPFGLAGLDPQWSRHVNVNDVVWHVLERPATDSPVLTVIAVHGNPTWSYLWRRLLAQSPDEWRVIAVDQIGMGYSQRPDTPRLLEDRIHDLGQLTKAMNVDGPVVVAAHDWGGPVALGWALEHPDNLRGVVLTNTAVHQPNAAQAPRLIRVARWGPLRRVVTQRTPLFTHGTTALSASRGRPLARDVVHAFKAPYQGAKRRRAIADFVADIPLEDEHPSAAVLDGIAAGVRTLDVPVLLAWGADDPVFSDIYLRDLLKRMPHADVHRYERAGHLVMEDAPESIADVITWINDRVVNPIGAERKDDTDESQVGTGGHPLQPLSVVRADNSVAIADLRGERVVTWATLAGKVNDVAAGLHEYGVKPGDRVALLVPPSAELVAVVYACWRAGAAVIVADTGLGLRGMRRAIRGAHPDHIIAINPGHAVTRSIHIPGLRVLAGTSSGAAAQRLLGYGVTLPQLAAAGRRAIAAGAVMPPGSVDDEALIAFTSGSTGPAKGVIYTHERLSKLRDALVAAYDIRASDDGLVAAFAPWAVLGPALGIPSAIPDMDLTDPSTLTMESFSEAAAAVKGTIAWTSPTGLRALVETAPLTSARPRSLRLLMVAGAPVPATMLAAAAAYLPGARLATPYGMTEALPLTEVDLNGVLAAGEGNGVLVGAPVEGVDIMIDPLGADGSPSGSPAESTGGPDRVAVEVTGEILVRSPWMKSSYDRRWAVQHRSADIPGWHRTGDVGHLDGQGRLWVEGRLAHVITTPRGPVTPVAAEIAAARAAGVDLAACVGVGPQGRQVVIIAVPGGGRRMRVADVDTIIAVRAAVRDACGHDVSAVLVVPELPVDVRHRSKINRIRVAHDASKFLAGSIKELQDPHD